MEPRETPLNTWTLEELYGQQAHLANCIAGDVAAEATPSETTVELYRETTREIGHRQAEQQAFIARYMEARAAAE